MEINMSAIEEPLKVSLHGMTPQSGHLMIKYLELCCKKIASVVDTGESQVEIIDVDLAKSKTILKDRLEQPHSKPLIVLSMHEVLSDKVIYVKKPINASAMVNALLKAKDNVLSSFESNKLEVSLNSDNDYPINLNIASKLPNKATDFSTATEVDLDDPFEMDDLLLEPDNVLNINEPKTGTFENSDNRKMVRYSFQAIEAKLVSKQLDVVDADEIVNVLNASSKGALVRLKEPVKFDAIVMLILCFDPVNTFNVSARIVRKEGDRVYGLLFVNYQHELADYLIDSKQAYSVI